MPDLSDASAPDPNRGMARVEGGRPEEFEPSPEGRLMREGTAVTSNLAPLTPDMVREAFDEIDNAAADDAANDVRRREHSAD